MNTEWIYFYEEPKRHKGIIEFGRTRRTVEERNREKRSIDPWVEIARYPVANCELAERAIIKATRQFRYNNSKEILEIVWGDLKKIVEPILEKHSCEQYKARQEFDSWLNSYYYPTRKNIEKEYEMLKRNAENEHRELYNLEQKEIENLKKEMQTKEYFKYILGFIGFFYVGCGLFVFMGSGSDTTAFFWVLTIVCSWVILWNANRSEESGWKNLADEENKLQKTIKGTLVNDNKIIEIDNQYKPVFELLDKEFSEKLKIYMSSGKTVKLEKQC